MLTQIYEISSAQEAAAISAMGVDHIGVLVGDGRFPREQSPTSAVGIAASIAPPAKFSALFLSPDIAFIARVCRELSRRSCTWAAAPGLVTPEQVRELKRSIPGVSMMRSVPVRRTESIDIARDYEGIADFLLLDSYRAADEQIGALGVTHDWSISRQIVERVRTPVILAGGLGPDNVAEAIRIVRPAGVNSKTKTDKGDTHIKDLEKVEMFERAAKRAAAE